MDVREKVMELIDGVPPHEGKTFEEALADHLIANGVTVQEWISVEDRLPTESCTCLVACSDGRVGWHFYYNTFPDRVTHWMPMPEPPKE